MTRVGTCGFCGKRGVNKEHVWPDWLRKLVLKSRTAIGQKHFAIEVERSGELRRFSTSTLESTVHMPCAECNSSWMSEMEGAARLFMADMVSPGAKTVLGRDRQITLARWAVKTAMVFEFVAKPAPYFTWEERLRFKNERDIPQSTFVWTGRYDATQPAHALQHRIGQRRSDASITHAYSFSLTAGFLAVQVFSFRGPTPTDDRVPVKPGPWQQALLRVWPPGDADLLWPPVLEIDHDHLGDFDSRFVTEYGDR